MPEVEKVVVRHDNVGMFPAYITCRYMYLTSTSQLSPASLTERVAL